MKVLECGLTRPRFFNGNKNLMSPCRFSRAGFVYGKRILQETSVRKKELQVVRKAPTVSRTGYSNDNESVRICMLPYKSITRLHMVHLKLEIDPSISDPARPDQNGRHERMHRDLKAAVPKPFINCTPKGSTT